MSVTDAWRIEIFENGKKLTDMFWRPGISLIDIIGLGGCRVLLGAGRSAIYTRVFDGYVFPAEVRRSNWTRRVTGFTA